MPAAKIKSTSNPGALVQASKINVFQVTILVLLFVVAGVVFKYYSHGATKGSIGTKAQLQFAVNGLPRNTTVNFSAGSKVGSCNATIAVKMTSNGGATYCTGDTVNTLSASGTYPTTVTVGGKTYTAYQTCGGVYSTNSSGGAGGCGAGADGTFTGFSDSPGDTTGHWMAVDYQ